MDIEQSPFLIYQGGIKKFMFSSIYDTGRG